jgi:diguanylate cyclase (GGDEF)-like protein
MSASRNNVHFDNFFILIKDYCPRIRGLMVFDNELDFVWQDDSAQLAAKRVQPLLQVLKDGDTDDEIIDVDGAGFAELVKLKNEHGEMGLALCLSLEARQDAVPESVVQQRAFGLLGELLLADYQQSRALASKEDELNYMTDELTRRYEELNLIYKAEDQAMNIHHGRELLRQLVMNTSRFLNVDIIYLFIGGKNIAMHKFRGDNPVFQSDALFTTLRDSVQPMLEADKTALVINHIEDAIKLGIEDDMPFKVIASPVVNIENEVIGLLAIASQNFAVDFSNSDRNLLDVMSKKASKIAQSHFDPLTGLENSNSFELILKDLMKQSWGLDVQHAIANIDIDRMAVINDISGRDAGDLLIKKVGKTLAGMVRSRDVVARLGSDKFGVLLENCDLATARTVMKKIAHAVSAIDMEWEGESHEVSLSMPRRSRSPAC